MPSDDLSTLYLNQLNRSDVYFYRDSNNLVIRAASGIYAVTLNEWFASDEPFLDKVKFKDGSIFYFTHTNIQ
ncbi:MAG: hypothetical protein RIR36_342 [Bacteroidota bacterium]